jgi:hypothetical protein
VTPASARSLRRRRVADLRVAEPGLSLRQMARRLGISRDTVRRDLEDIDRASSQDAPSSDAMSQTAPQASAGVVAESATPGEASATGPSQGATAAGLPLQAAQPLAGVDLAQWPAARRDLADLVRSGRTAEGVAHMAITAVAHAYRQALARGDLQVGQRFLVSTVTLTALPMPASRTAEPVEAG